MTAGPFIQSGINYYVPKMQAAPGVGDDGLHSVSLGMPLAALATGILAAGSAITNAAKTFNALSNPTNLPFNVDAPYGRTISVTGATAGDNAVLTVRGVDYLGQPTAENVTLNGTTAVQGNKAFKRVDSVAVAAGNANASSSISFGYGAKLGLPFKTAVVLAEFNGDASATVGTLTAPVVTDPATLTTGDPRGTYTPSTTLNGSNAISITARAIATRNTNDNGGLHGIRQFFS